MLPVVSLGAEYLVMGHLMRRNILAYKAPPHNEGYDLICIHPNPRKVGKQICVQVKSRYATDSSKGVFIKKRALSAFDYLNVVLLNVGYYYGATGGPGGRMESEFYTLPSAFVRRHYIHRKGGLDRLILRELDVSSYKNERGFELIARDLGIPYPRRPKGTSLKKSEEPSGFRPRIPPVHG
jgi:hypothetical protein